MKTLLAVPSTTRQLPEDYVERVKRVHESGGYGSKGYGILYSCFSLLLKLLICPSICRYGYDWKREEADKNLLRTHTTAVSSRLLYLLAQVLTAMKSLFDLVLCILFRQITIFFFRRQTFLSHLCLLKGKQNWPFFFMVPWQTK